ncbi:hypothetical protein GCM10020255_094320 [Rhodococcus baikonurensis]
MNKTGRLVVVHEAPKFLGVGAEIAAHVAEHCFYQLESPIRRVTGFDIPIRLPSSSNSTFRTPIGSSQRSTERWQHEYDARIPVAGSRRGPDVCRPGRVDGQGR